MRPRLNSVVFAMASVCAAILTSCTPDDTSNGNGIVADMDASFTVTPVSANRFSLQATNPEGTIVHFWNTGSANVRAGGNYEAFLPDIGTYTITHTITGIGGTKISSEQTVEVTTADPVAGNIIMGGRFNTAGEFNDNWDVSVIAPGANWAFDNGKATVSGGGWGHAAIYQAVQVEANKPYKIDMSVTSNGSSEMWFELYASMVAPTPGVDYSAGGKRMQINTWAGCGMNAMNGLFSSLQCAANETSGNIVTFPTSGTAYILIKCGGNNIGNISIDNVEMRRTE